LPFLLYKNKKIYNGSIQQTCNYTKNNRYWDWNFVHYVRPWTQRSYHPTRSCLNSQWSFQGFQSNQSSYLSRRQQFLTWLWYLPWRGPHSKRLRECIKIKIRFAPTRPFKVENNHANGSCQKRYPCSAHNRSSKNVIRLIQQEPWRPLD
jgi:hypothetical protein